MLSNKQRELIKDTIRESLRRKFENYNPQAMAKPFHTRLLGADRLALYSFLQSLITTFGASVFEPVGAVLARKRFQKVSIGAKVGTHIHKSAEEEVSRIVNKLGIAELEPNALSEVQAIRAAVHRGGEENGIKLRKADLRLEIPGESIVLIEMKTAKPNISGFEDHKRQLLKWVAVTLRDNPDAVVSVMIGIPYNPYEPEKYKWWTMRSMFDLDEQIKVGRDFWNFLAGEEIYDDLLGCFEQVGIEMRQEIDDYFANFR